MTDERRRTEHLRHLPGRDAGALKPRVRDDPLYWEALAARIHNAARARNSVVHSVRDETGWLAARAGTLLLLAVGATAAATILAVRLRPQIGDRSDGQRIWAAALSSGGPAIGVGQIAGGNGVAPLLADLLLANVTPPRPSTRSDQ